MFSYLTGNAVLHTRKERLPVICPFYASNDLWTNCAEFVIMAKYSVIIVTTKSKNSG